MKFIKDLMKNILGLINNAFGLLKSKRAIFTIAIFVAWFMFGWKGINNGIDFIALASYFAALSPFVIGYIYGETKRPSGCCNDEQNCKK
jgi:cytochrome bd-type quinol oxidase subunit 1